MKLLDYGVVYMVVSAKEDMPSSALDADTTMYTTPENRSNLSSGGDLMVI